MSLPSMCAKLFLQEDGPMQRVKARVRIIENAQNPLKVLFLEGFLF
jgi:hypothetical protein